MMMCSGGVAYTRTRLKPGEPAEGVAERCSWEMGKVSAGWDTLKTRHWDSGGTQVPHG